MQWAAKWISKKPHSQPQSLSQLAAQLAAKVQSWQCNWRWQRWRRRRMQKCHSSWQQQLKGEQQQREKPSVSFWLWKEQRLARLRCLRAWLRTRLSGSKQKCQPGPRSCRSRRAEGAAAAPAADLATILQQRATNSAMSSGNCLRAASKLLQLLHAANLLALIESGQQN